MKTDQQFSGVTREVYRIGSLVLENRIARALAEGVSRYPIYRMVRFAARVELDALFDAIALDRGWRAFKECRAHIDEPPTTYLKRHFWYDTVNFAAGPLKLAIEFAGADHVLAGSDYPHKIGSISLMLEAIRGLPISDANKAGILGGNGAALLGV